MACIQDTLESVCSDFWGWVMKEFPEFSTLTGDSRYDDCLESYTLESFDKRKTDVSQFSLRLQALDRTRFTVADQHNYDLLCSSINDYFLSSYKWYRYVCLTPVNNFEGVAVNNIVNVLAAAGQTMGAYGSIVARLKKYPGQIKQQVELMRMAISIGKTHHAASMHRVCSNIDQTLRIPIESSSFFKPFRDSLDLTDSIDAVQKASLCKEAHAAILDIYESLSDFGDFIKNEYMPRTRSFHGVSGLPLGSEFYHACLCWHATINVTAQDVHALGLSEVRRISDNISKIMLEVGFTGSAKEFQTKLRNTSELYLSSEDELLKRYETLIEQVTSRLSLVLNQDDIPSIPCIVEAMTTDGPGARYNAPLRQGEPGKFLINVHNPKQRATIHMIPLVLHEVSPGHHCQCSIQQRAADVPAFRKFTDFSKYYAVPYNFPFYSAYVEGWGLYAEYLGEEMHLYETLYDRYGRCSAEMVRAARLVVDTGIHAFGWSKEEAVDYLGDIVFMTKDRIENEVDRIITWPGQACAYKIGELKIKELRQKAERELMSTGGGGFDLKEFHAQVLHLGPSPLALLEKCIEDWLDAKILQRQQTLLSGD